MKTVILPFVLFSLLTTHLQAQRDAPVWESYLPRISVYHEKDDALTVDLLFKKNGGPYEHTEHQCYILAYLKSDEQQILKLASDPALIKKQSGRTNLFSERLNAKGLNDKLAQEKSLILDVLLEKKLVVLLTSQVAKINSLDGKTPIFQTHEGNPNCKEQKVSPSIAFLSSSS